MSALRFTLNHLLQGIALVLAVVVLNFMLVHAAPGDPVETIAGVSGGMSDELKADLRKQYGLDKPLVVQLGVYLNKVVHGDLGFSYFFNLPVSGLIAERLPATLLLVIVSVLLAFLAGTAMGVLASRKPNGVLSQSITVVSLIGFAAPVFWTGIMLVILFAATVPWFPVAGMRSIASSASAGSLGDMLDVAHHLVLPVITILGLQFGNVMAGAILVETVFNWPGLGRLAFESVLRRDYPTILGVLLFSSIVVVIMNQLTDLAYRLVDPRIKVS